MVPVPRGLVSLEWIEKAERFALGFLELSPYVFGRLTVYEYNLKLEGYLKRQRQRLKQEASWVVLIVNMCRMGGNKISLQELVGLDPEEEQAIRTKVEQRKAERSRKRGDD